MFGAVQFLNVFILTVAPSYMDLEHWLLLVFFFYYELLKWHTNSLRRTFCCTELMTVYQQSRASYCRLIIYGSIAKKF